MTFVCSTDWSFQRCMEFKAANNTRALTRIYTSLAAIVGVSASSLFYLSEPPLITCGSIIVTVPVRGTEALQTIVEQFTGHLVGDVAVGGAEIRVEGEALHFSLFMNLTTTSTSTTTSSASATTSSSAPPPPTTTSSRLPPTTTMTATTTTVALLPPADSCPTSNGNLDCYSLSQVCCRLNSEVNTHVWHGHMQCRGCSPFGVGNSLRWNAGLNLSANKTAGHSLMPSNQAERLKMPL